jgi:cytochrome oxidase Cu insertion factor (SCO1/SenC/PrrC family)
VFFQNSQEFLLTSGDGLSILASYSRDMKMKLTPKDKAPDFNLPDQEGGKVSLSDFKGRKVLLFFYPKAGTSG